MARATVILIAAPELIPALRERVGSDAGVLTFADSDPVRAMEAIAAERPPVVALERLFAASPRGAALIARIKDDPSLNASQIRILSHDSDYRRISPRRLDAPSRKTASGPAKRFDTGTRRWPRFKMKESAFATVNGRPARLIDLSAGGAQLSVSESLRARQPASVGLGPAGRAVAVAGTVVWARAELSRKGPAARIGIEFTNPDAAAVAAFLDAHRLR
jgi:hypothetical protein